ncbi:MAG: site-2 protease family protein [Sedimentisphaerales bacterium]|jgi:regulator of sigma E protease|nr:site-2 protease family protein [Sedimentisphaerales bacterium]HNY77869.1 site-2 protease family protein [Sedimentisphaerales bacterium]HOC63082.1 site-2 protease family protein [Sedimentisphaerales bacterium]HOH64044.1 site-2 protease family protein [Sedimentisphaerales bacterium]HQA88089.1 site-2 protease family protein [Sedimentisphaerales bacterium]
MSKKGSSSNKILGAVFWLAVLAVVVYLIVRYATVSGNLALVMIGFGSVVLVHEFGHFIVAKLAGIKVEAFSIFMPPTLLGIQRTPSGLKLRVLPSFIADEQEDAPGEGEGDTAPSDPTSEAGTEYRVGLIPFGGYVKLLGQDDIGPVKQLSDPRSFSNKSLGARIAVVAAGVTFNIISAAILLMVVFLIGIDFPPPVVGGVVPGSSAEKAGLRSGDEFIEIAGRSEGLEFSSLILAAALSGRDEAVPVVVRRRDGSTQSMDLLASEQPNDQQIREFGILAPMSLTLAELTDPSVLEQETGLLPGDRVVAVDGNAIEHHWAYEEAVQRTFAPRVTITAERPNAGGGVDRIGKELALAWLPSREAVPSDATLCHIYSMVPRLRVREAPQPGPVGQEGLRTGDIIVAAADVQHPTYAELREITAAHEGKPLAIQVVRADANGVERATEVTVTPRKERGSDRVVIGFLPELDAEHAVVAKTVSVEGGVPRLDIPRGATITSVNGKPVTSFYDIVAETRQWDGQPVKLEYRLDGQASGGVTLANPMAETAIAVESTTVVQLPFKPMERLYKARTPIEAIQMGYRRTVMFVAMTYVTLKQLIAGLLSPKLLMGPVGIMVSSYQIVAREPLVYYAYFLGLIGASIAVLNLMPMPPFDGGLIVLMLVEKIKGSPLSEKAQGVLAYAGWVIVGTLLIYVTFNDVLRTVRGFFS